MPVLGVLLALALTGPLEEQDCERSRCDRARGDRAGGSRGYAFFEFAPSSGAGMGAACACTTPTGAKGEALTFTRASSGTCLKSGTTSGIANGDMVTCSTNQPRVMPGGDGSGGLGLLVEGARTNTALRSQELDNAVWTDVTSALAAPVRTANAAVAPDGTTTAERLQFPSCVASSGTYSAIGQVGAGVAPATSSVFLKGVSGSGTTSLNNGTGSVTVCTFNSTSWTRCTFSDGAGVTPLLGNNCAGTNGPFSATDVYAWGLQIETGTFASSYIATTSAAVTRAVEVPSFAVSLANTTGSLAATVVPLGTSETNDHGIIALSTAGPTTFRQLLDQAGAELFLYMSTGGSVSQAGGFPALTAKRVAGWWNASTRSVSLGGAAATTNAHSGTTATTLLEVGIYSATAGTNFNGVIKQVCADSAESRCR
jgi:hypothetical protein